MRRPTRGSAALAFLLTASIGCGARSSLVEGSGGSVGSGGSTVHGGSSSAQSVGESSTGAGCVDEVIATSPLGATALAVDGDTVYWGTPDGHVLRREGTATTTLATATGQISYIAIDASRLYYRDGTSVVAIPRSGGAATTIIDDPNGGMMAADAGVVFYLNEGLFNDGGVNRVGPDGVPETILTGLSSPKFIALDGDYVYADARLGSFQGTDMTGLLVRAPKNGGPSELVATGLEEPGGFAVVGDLVYIVDEFDGPISARGIRSVPKAGGQVTDLADTHGVFPLDVAVDATHAYVTGTKEPQNGGPTNNGTLLRIALDGSNAGELASTAGGVYTWVSLNDTAVFWTIDWTGGEPPPENATVRKKCK